MYLAAIRQKIKAFLSKKFVRDYFVLQSGALLSLFLSILASVIYARILQTELYGKYAIIFALAAFLGIFFDVGLTPSLTTLLSRAYAMKNREEVRDLFVYFFKVSIYIGFGLGGILMALSPLIGKYFYGDLLLGIYAGIVLLAGSLNLFFTALVLSLQMLRKITTLTIVENISKVLTKAVPIVIVLITFRLSGIVLGYLASVIVLGIISIWMYRALQGENPFLPSLSSFVRRFRYVPLSRYIKFGVVIALDKNVAKLSNLVPTLFMGMFLSASAVAFFRIALHYIMIPAYFLSPLSRLLNMQLPKSEIINRETFVKHFYQTTAVAFLVTAPMVGMLLLAAPHLISLLYGDDFQLSVPLTYPLAIVAVSMSFGVGFSALYRTLNKVNAALFLNLGVSLVMVVAMYFLIKYFSLKGAVIGVILWQILPMIGTYILALRYFFPQKSKEYS